MQLNKTVIININADLINTSDQEFDLVKLKEAITAQLNDVYQCTLENYKLNLSIQISILNKMSQCSPKKILFQIVDVTPSNNPTICEFKGLRIKLNKQYINDFITGINCRTIPHEIGHLLGWDHPHANAKFESINTTAHPLEQKLTEYERQCNLMSQSWYAQKAGLLLKNARCITEQQIELLLENYKSGSLNKNWHLKYFLWWKKIIN